MFSEQRGLEDSQRAPYVVYVERALMKKRLKKEKKGGGGINQSIEHRWKAETVLFTMVPNLCMIVAVRLRPINCVELPIRPVFNRCTPPST